MARRSGTGTRRGGARTRSWRWSRWPRATRSRSSSRSRDDMALRKYKPTTPGRRGSSVSDFSEVTRDRPERALVKKLTKKAGRNAYGRITTRHRGGGHKRRDRGIDLPRAKGPVPAQV